MRAVVLLSILAAALLIRGAAPSSGQQPPSTAATLNGASPSAEVGSLAVARGRSAVGDAPQTVIGEPLTGLPDTATAVTGTASWFCHPPRYPRCTRGVPAASYAAAAGPALRVGDWRGRIVKVCAGSRCVRVRLSDFCACPRRLIDLYWEPFRQIADPSRGLTRVSVTWGGSAGTGLPPTDMAR